jgi:energy-coupling factor transport system ATP-binding protein
LFEPTVAEDIAFWPKGVGLASDDIDRRVRGAMSMVGLDYETYAKRSPFTLSGGEMRKAAIAGILVLDPPVLIMDEPTVGLDPRGKRDLLELIKQINAKGTAVVMVTHDLDAVVETARRVLILRAGRLLCDAGIREAFVESGDTADLGLPTAARIARMMSKRGFVIEGDPLTIDELAESVLAVLERASA